MNYVKCNTCGKLHHIVKNLTINNRTLVMIDNISECCDNPNYFVEVTAR